MKQIMNMKRLSIKLLIAFLAIAIIPLFATLLFFYYSAEKGFQQLADKDQDETNDAVDAYMSTVADDLLRLTEQYASKGQFVNSFSKNDREKLLKQSLGDFKRLKQEQHVDVFEFGRVDGKVFLRDHNPEKYNDDKSDKPAIQTALSGDTIAGFEFGNSGLAIRAFAPIYQGNKIIGTLQTGIDESFISNLQKSMPNVELNFYDDAGKVMISSDSSKIGESFKKAEIIRKVSEGKKASDNTRSSLQSYLPLKDPTGTQVIGMIGIKKDISTIAATEQKLMKISLAAIAILLVLVTFTAIRMSRSISKPVRKVAKFMKTIAEGDLRSSLERTDRKDEIGTLFNTAILLRDNLQQVVCLIAEASEQVQEKSEEMLQSGSEMLNGSNQTAAAMIEATEAADIQANTISKMSLDLINVHERTEKASTNGLEIAAASQNLLSLTEKGNVMMEESISQMDKADSLVKESMEQVEKLNGQTQEIGRLVSMIQKISEQTRLLALNATIEATRAGEKGKGFAVVAAEVGKLSDQASSSTSEITEIAAAIQANASKAVDSLARSCSEVSEGKLQVHHTGTTYNSIRSSAHDILSEITELSEHLEIMREDSLGMKQASEQIATVAEEQASGAESVSASCLHSNQAVHDAAENAERLASLASDLQDRIAAFKR
ncbi:methyl-accepting chemotaxis protein [Aciduricibacillus chroicocephali]|uniref:Methyl-accepting chemotaxis protein n=1 Tax=Aciduricibacillus chroicocephali TaxID=3054939 RepID=A0ABY9KWB2_9BACI|nr:methyl-accepting chemotaxis protein [Bacillaceae bacterium 44XB]